MDQVLDVGVVGSALVTVDPGVAAYVRLVLGKNLVPFVCMVFVLDQVVMLS